MVVLVAIWSRDRSGSGLRDRGGLGLDRAGLGDQCRHAGAIVPASWWEGGLGSLVAHRSPARFALGLAGHDRARDRPGRSPRPWRGSPPRAWLLIGARSARRHASPLHGTHAHAHAHARALGLREPGTRDSRDPPPPPRACLWYFYYPPPCISNQKDRPRSLVCHGKAGQDEYRFIFLLDRTSLMT